jgi:multidrug transporter EmrE-like cation transporter
MNGWLYLAIAIGTEIIGSTGLKYSKGFTVLLPSMVVVVGYAISFYFFSLSLKTIHLNTAYAVWSGLGTALIAILGWLLLSESMSFLKAAGIVLVIIGVVVINLAGEH